MTGPPWPWVQVAVQPVGRPATPIRIAPPTSVSARTSPPCSVTSAQVDRIRLEQDLMPPIDLDRYAGIITGGSPFNSSDPLGQKPAVQRRVESDIRANRYDTRSIPGWPP